MEGGTELPSFLMDLRESYRRGALSKIVGRRAEIAMLGMALSGGLSPLILGEPGVGKTSLVVGVGIALETDSSMQRRMDNATILLVNLDDVVKESLSRENFNSSWASALSAVAKVNQRGQRAILAVDQLEMLQLVDQDLVWVREDGDAPVASIDILVSLVEKFGLQVIGITTSRNFEKYFDGVGSCGNIFSEFRVKEPSESEAVEIIRQKRSEIGKHYSVQILDSAVLSAVSLSAVYMNHRCLPEKAIDLLCEACVRAAAAGASRGSSPFRSAELIDTPGFVTEDAVARVVNAWTRIPMRTLMPSHGSESDLSRLTRIRSVRSPAWLKGTIRPSTSFNGRENMKIASSIYSGSYQELSQGDGAFGLSRSPGFSPLGQSTFEAQANEQGSPLKNSSRERRPTAAMEMLARAHAVGRSRPRYQQTGSLAGSFPDDAGRDTWMTGPDGLRANPFSCTTLSSLSSVRLRGRDYAETGSLRIDNLSSSPSPTFRPITPTELRNSPSHPITVGSWSGEPSSWMERARRKSSELPRP